MRKGSHVEARNLLTKTCSFLTESGDDASVAPRAEAGARCKRRWGWKWGSGLKIYNLFLKINAQFIHSSFASSSTGVISLFVSLATDLSNFWYESSGFNKTNLSVYFSKNLAIRLKSPSNSLITSLTKVGAISITSRSLPSRFSAIITSPLQKRFIFKIVWGILTTLSSVWWWPWSVDQLCLDRADLRRATFRLQIASSSYL